MKFAKDRGLEVIQDDAYNVVIKKAGSRGAEDHAPVMLQGHMDMVCEKRAGVEHDFEKDGLDLIIRDGRLTANGTTLGGDNGVAVALMLMVLDDDEIEHPPVECVFTTEEEVGLNGAKALDKSVLKARTMINMDSEDEGVATVSCAGGLRVQFTKEIQRTTVQGSLLTLKVEGLLGGHSGQDIDKERQNADLLMARMIQRLLKETKGQLVSFNGGTKDNAIPRECEASRMFEGNFGSKFFTFELDDWVFTESTAREKLLKHFETKNLKGFGVEHLKNGIIASGAILQYLTMTQHTQIGHITSLARIEEDKYVRLDKFTVRSLELIGSMNDGGSSLLNVIDRTISPMGARLLKRWMVFPLKDEKPINDRLNVVEYFFRQPDFKELIEEQLHLIGDLERIISKVAVGRVSPREVVQLKVALQAIEPIKQACLEADNASLNRIGEQLNLCISIRDRIAKEINNDPPLLINKGGVIKDGVNEELDELRRISYSGKDYLLQIQQRESEQTGIPSLKVAYNNVFGYYIEVRNIHKDKVPQEWIRKQTLVNAERYITQELKVYEEKILGAEDKILVLETQLYTDLVQALTEFIPQIQINANQIARLDCLLSFANVARENNYIRPVIEDNDVLDIRQGRHPVIEKQLPIGEKYIANDVMLDSTTQQIIIITGPNMAGKSALLRQTALITLLAQIGSFVPAESAHIGLVDKIFTRVGASDNISVGESTFMVEMNEAADILNNVSSRSLVLFDELGRGTSTYDGISIAWAIVEYIHEHPKAKARTLFATHYHELNEMEKSFKRIKNYNVSVKEVDNKVIFLRKLERGGSEHSFGIHVAKMAGMPKSIVKRANTILKQLESDNRQQGISGKPLAEVSENRSGMQLSFFQLDDPILCQIRDEILNLDVNNLTPIEALNKLNDIKKIVRGK